MATGTQKLTVLRNIGKDHQKMYGLPDLKEGDECTVSPKQAHILINVLQVAEPSDLRAVAAKPGIRGVRAAKPQELATAKTTSGERAPGISTTTGLPMDEDEFEEESDDDGDEDGGGDDGSPVDNITASEAIEKIGRMRSRDQLEHIASNDQRVTVQNAAKRRLDEIGQ